MSKTNEYEIINVCLGIKIAIVSSKEHSSSAKEGDREMKQHDFV